MSVMYITYNILRELLLCNVLHGVGNMYWLTFLRGQFLLLLPTS